MSRITQSSAHARVLKPSFLYGAASASHQIEGGYLADGKSLSVWDAYWQANNIKDNGNVACDSYNLWKEDVKLLKQYGANVYRFSISWSRVLPEGKAGTPVNEAGIKYYSDLCDALLAEGIQPCITVFHWDHPQCLQEEYGGFKDQKQIVRDFVGLADLLFARLGDRCKHWITINEVSTASLKVRPHLKPIASYLHLPGSHGNPKGKLGAHQGPRRLHQDPPPMQRAYCRPLSPQVPNSAARADRHYAKL